MRKIIFALIVLSFLLVACQQAEDQEMCAQVITHAENPETGTCEQFPTPCDVPDGWERCDPSLNGSSEGQFCGGIQGLSCPDGYECQLEGDYPDAGGECVKTNDSSGELIECQTDADCVKTGCSNQLCMSSSAAKEGGLTTCEWEEQYSCYREQNCVCINNKCDWGDEERLTSCLSEYQ